jgi:hypothetical protein
MRKKGQFADDVPNFSDQVIDRDLIYCPGLDDDSCSWLLPSDCLLDAPPDLGHKWPIMEIYKKAFLGTDLTLVTRFFQKNLGVASWSWKDILSEIEHLQDEECSDFDRIRSQYESLNKARRKWVVMGINASETRYITCRYRGHATVDI